MDYADWEQLLNERFPSGSGQETEWFALKQRLAIGQPVTGIVFARAPFGAWIDLGVGFPALLEIIYIAELTPERYQSGDWCQVDSELTAFVGGFSDSMYQIGLWQKRLNE